MDNYSSKLLEQAVDELAKLPGIGRRTALRLALHLLKQDVNDVEILGETIIKLRQEIKHCDICHNISDSERCSICSDSNRDQGIICVVQDIRDVMAIENTGQFKGVYHVLGGLISPLDGIGPSDLSIDELFDRLKEDETKELIMALNPTVEGDTTNFFIYRKLKDNNIKITTIARGVAIGDELEYADEVTLGRSIANRIPYEQSVKENK